MDEQNWEMTLSFEEGKKVKVTFFHYENGKQFRQEEKVVNADSHTIQNLLEIFKKEAA